MVTYLYGAYGTGNLGDDLLLKAAMQAHLSEDCRVIAFGKPLLRTDVPYIANAEFVDNPSKYLARGDNLIFAGGGLFWSDEHIKIMLRVVEAAHAAGCKIRVERIGVQGVHLDLESSRRLFSLCSYISVRDENSVMLLRRLDVTYRALYEPDFVLTLQDYGRVIHGPRKAIGINHAATPFFHNIAHREKALEVYGLVSEQLEEYDFLYVPHTVHFKSVDQNDLVTGEQFEKHSQGRIRCLAFPDNAEDLVDIYAGLAMGLGWRYHLNVLCKLVGIPTALVCQNDEHKYRAFASENQIPILNFDAELDDLVSDIVRLIRSEIKNE